MERNNPSKSTSDSAQKEHNDKETTDFKEVAAKFKELPLDPEVEQAESIDANEELKNLFLLPDDDPETAKLKLEIQRLSNNVKGEEDTRKMRRIFAERIYRVTSWWLVGIFVILMLQGFHFIEFYLSDTVLAALIGATGGIGLLAIILRNLFPSDEKKSS